jgi:sugar phosphate permease
MLSAQFAAWLDRRGIHYSYVIVAVTFLTMLATAGTLGLPGALIVPLGKEFGWDIAQVSGPLALRILIFGLMAPFSAALIERYGVRRIALLAISLIAIGLAGAFVMQNLWQLVFFWGLLTGVGSGMTALVLGAIVANRWFTAHRGLVLGLLTASTATGQLVFLPLAATLVEKYGWRIALVPSFASLLLAAILVLLFMRDRPADLGQVALGETNTAPQAAQNAPANTSHANPFGRAFGVLREAGGRPVFIILAGTFFICGLSTNGLIQTHLIPFCGDFGMNPIEAASLLAMMGVFDFIGTIGSGWLSDRVDSRWLLFFYYGLRGLSLLFLPSSSFTLYGLSLFAVFYGLDWIATVPPTVKLTAVYFGREKAGLVFGWIFAAHQLGAATAAYGAGLSRATLSTYLPAFYTAGAVCLIAAVLSASIGRTSFFGIPLRASRVAAE